MVESSGTLLAKQYGWLHALISPQNALQCNCANVEIHGHKSALIELATTAEDIYSALIE